MRIVVRNPGEPLPGEVDGHPVASGRTGRETLARVKQLVSEGKAPLAHGGLDRATLARCREAGAVGFVLDAALWLLPDSPLDAGDREALARLTLQDFASGDVALPSGVSVGRDALLAPIYARRAASRDEALRLVAQEAAAAPPPEAPPRAASQASAPRAATAPPASEQAPPAPATAAPALPDDWPYETRPLPEAVAIIGVGAVLPKARNAPDFWRNVLNGVDAIVEVPSDRWDPAVHYDPDPSATDRTYTKIGGFVTDFTFDPMRFRIPPKTAQQLDKVQQMALAAAAEALADAGYDQKPFDRSRCAVILGNSLGGEQKDETNKRVHLAEFEAALRAAPGFQALPAQERERALQNARDQVLAKVPPITEDTMPGELSNVIAGRLANVLNLTGKNLTTDAACASSHAAIDVALRTIFSGEADMVLCGGADRSMDPGTFVKFSKIGALSPRGSSPFDARADGFVMGEGAAILLLKRLSDAIRDGDRIYAVIRGVGSSSDGRGKGITAPNPEGQKLAVRRALAVADLVPRYVGLVEAHGTSTRVGDVVEVESLAAIYEGLPPRSVALGSVKSQIGHLKSAAGAAGMLKVAFALRDKVLPPSINFEQPNPNIAWDKVPFRVVTEPEPWAEPPRGEPRRAAVSAFGFGGTNFHVILEEYVPAYHRRVLEARAAPAAAVAPAPAHAPAPRASARPRVEAELVVLGASGPAQLAALAREAATAAAHGTLADVAPRLRTPAAHAQPCRLAVGATDRPTLVQSLESAAALVADGKGRAALPLKVKGAAYGEGPRPPGRIAFLFPGQGSQYVNMMRDLAARHEVVAATFEEADAVLEPLLGKKLTSLLFVDPQDADAVARAEEALKQTEVTQPAMLAADVAMFRLLLAHNVRPDMVAGHSLGEYAALVAAGVLSFRDALLAVSARGKEMASVQVPDKGLMASFAAGPEEAQRVLDHVQGYAVAANKNCPVQTVVAGATDAVRQAVKLAEKAGIQAMMLPVSAAFHTEIVAPASQPLRRVLDRLEFRPPAIPVYTNVTAQPYPQDPDQIRDILARQVAAPVEWVAELEALYEAGARLFVEVGPKRALTGFVEATLGRREGTLALLTNHPKRGDLPSFLDAIARLAALGLDLGLPTAPPETPQPAAREAPVAAPPVAARPASPPMPRATAAPGETATFDAFRAAVQPALEAALQAGYATFATELARLRVADDAYRRYGLEPVDVVVSGASLGLPGQAHRVFDDANFERLFEGENRIDRLDPSWASRFLEKNIVRLVKGEGEPVLEAVRDPAEAIKLAGRRGSLDLEKDYEVPRKLVQTLDVTSKLALAAAYEALHDAGVPLVREETVMRNGKTLHGGWVLPPQMRDDTAIVFASAFPGLDNLLREVGAHLARRYAGRTVEALDALYQDLIEAAPAERRGRLNAFYAEHRARLQEAAGSAEALEAFNRHFLFSILSLGHAEVAEVLRARGPNTQVNAACASTTQAVAIAEDWLRTGRARRVLVLGADDATSEHLLEWIGSGFLASGAATTAASVEDGALPFDRRRHGMILGMGAVGLVLERREDVEARGMAPVARLLATRIGNSAYHGSRLDVDHIAREARAVVASAAARAGLAPEAMAARTIFVSHETYTPARGGSAGAEAAALRAAFGSGAPRVLITNTKGFTGHAMGAGLEDALAVKALQLGRVPPIANLREIDPDFADLQLSRGGPHDRRFAVRFAAGFGSQLAIAVFEKMADGARRVVDAAAHQAWLDQCAGGANARAERVGRTYRIVARDDAAPVRTVPVQAPALVAPAPRPAAGREDVLRRVVGLVSEKTGYPADVLDPTLDMEADLGIDTVKQAEIFGALREAYALPREEGIRIKDYPTLGHVADYVASRLGAAQPAEAAVAAPAPVAVVAPPAPRAPSPPPSAPPAAAAMTAPVATGDALARVTAIIAEKTGYPADVLDPTLDMEADLGIDTVKQAEIFGEVRTLFQIPRVEGIKIKDYPTIGHVARFVEEHAPKAAAAPASAPETVAQASAGATTTPILRRAPRVVAAPADEGAPRSAYVVGGGALAEALRARLPADAGEVAVFAGDAAALFAFARAHAARLEEGAMGILALTELGGDHGVTRAAGWEQGGVTGLAKSLAAEFPRAWIRALDLDPDEPVDARVAHVLAELRVKRAPVEVGRTRDGRVAVRTVPLPVLPAAQPDVREGDVVLVTGGARGITAEILRALAPRRPILVLVGRTGAPDDAEADRTDADFARLKEEAKATLAQRGERATPVAIERAVAPARARTEVARTLRELRAAGATVEYAACDVSDERALGELLAGVRARHGRVDGVLHAAGVEESKRLADKDEGAFARAWGPKAAAAGALARLTEADALRFFVMFGSVAGRYGNAAQADYSAANDALAKLARALRARGTPAAVLCWGPWGEAGMATRGSTLQVLEAAGVEAIPTHEGVEAFLRELATLPEPEVVLAKGLGMLESRESASRRLALRADDVALDHHRVEGVPYLAGVLGLAAFADAAPFPVAGFEDVRFDYPVKLLRDASVEATLDVGGDGRARLTTVPPGPRPEPRTHFTARVLAAAPAIGVAEALDVEPWGFADLYPPFFHGPAFRVLAEATRVGVDALEARGLAGAIPPMAATLEGAFQALGLWGLAVGGVMALPERAARIAAPGPFDPGRTTYHVTRARLDEGRVRGDVVCRVGDAVVAALEDVALVVTGQAPRDLPAPACWRPETLALGGRPVVRVRVAHAEALLARPTLWPRYLSPAERQTLAGFPAAKRQAEWLAATLAGKSALRAAGDARAWAEIEVLRDADGVPVAPPGSSLSLSHAGGEALACLVAAGRVGVDVEAIAERAPSFEEEAFTPAEREAFPVDGTRPAAVASAWAAKEAVLKALGVGLSVDLHAVRLHERAGGFDVELDGAAKDRFGALDVEAVEVHVTRDETVVRALAVLRPVARQG